MKALVAGWFSFEQMGATAGDLISRDVVLDWLVRAGRAYDVALAAPFAGGVNWREVDPADYSELVFVCGPFGNGPPVSELLRRFSGARLVGVNLSLLQPLDEWDPFDLLLERDSSRGSNPDLVFLGRPASTPVVGLVLIHEQPEYGTRDAHVAANAALERLLATRDVAAVRIDTRLDEANQGGLRTAAQIETLIGRMDVVLTTRLHGLVLALKSGVPVVAVDPVRGGAKVSRQAATLGWPHVLAAETLSDAALAHALEECLSPPARTLAADCARGAREALRDFEPQFRRLLELGQ